MAYIFSKDPNYKIFKLIMEQAEKLGYREAFILMNSCINWVEGEKHKKNIINRLAQHNILNEELKEEIDDFFSGNSIGFGKFEGFNQGWNNQEESIDFQKAFIFLNDIDSCSNLTDIRQVVNNWKGKIIALTPSRLGTYIHLLKPELVAIYNKGSKDYLFKYFNIEFKADIDTLLDISEELAPLLKLYGCQNFADFDKKFYFSSDELKAQNFTEEAHVFWSEKHEGHERKVFSYKRNQNAVKAIKSNAKGICQGCKSNMNNTYGFDILHVHHITPFSNLNINEKISEDDLCALCPNCHATIHKVMNTTEKIVSVKDLKKHLKKFAK